MKSLRTFKDEFGIVRKNGEEWLITMKDNETHIPGVYEEVRYSSLSRKLQINLYMHVMVLVIGQGYREIKIHQKIHQEIKR